MEVVNLHLRLRKRICCVKEPGMSYLTLKSYQYLFHLSSQPTCYLLLVHTYLKVLNSSITYLINCNYSRLALRIFCVMLNYSAEIRKLIHPAPQEQ